MQMTDNLRGAGLMMGALALFTINDTCTKLLAGQVPLAQIITLRGIVTTVALALMAWHFGAFRVRLDGRTWRLVLLRMVAEVGGAWFFLKALFAMPLANVTAVLQSAPLLVTLAAALFLREPVGWRRLAAILVGFAGVLLIVRPGASDFDHNSIYSLTAVVFVTARDLFTRKMPREVPSMLITFVTSIGVTATFALVSVAGQEAWVPLDTRASALIFGASGALIFAYICSVGAMRSGEVSFVSPFRYTGLIWALVLGFFVFGTWPVWQTFLGAGIVVASGLFTLFREHRVRARPIAAATSAHQAGPAVRRPDVE